MALHVHPKMPWVLDVTLGAGKDPETATAADVVAWRSGENDGLWSALVLASQAYRFAATHDPAARASLATLLDGERMRMQITGIRGLFTRQLIPPGVDGLVCPTDATRYVPSPDKTGNQWVRIGDDGCIQTADATSLAFASTAHCGLDAFKGWCFLDNVSQDEYSGHVFALGAVARLVDDPALNAQATDMLAQIGHHLVDHGMEFVDWDGKPTEYGKVHPGAPGDTPGYLAVLGMSFLATAADGTGDVALGDAYDALGWTDPLDAIDLWSGADGCLSNWNDLSMLGAAFHQVLWNDVDPTRRAVLEAAFDRELAHPTVTARGKLVQHDAWFDVMWAAQKPLGPGTDGPAYDAVKDAVCQLRQFPRSNHIAAHDTTALAPAACDGRKGESLASTAFGVADRCAATYVWWGNPYIRTTCAADPTQVQQPSGYLLPYWMARYYGFVSADE
jgi:hypothetical protein